MLTFVDYKKAFDSIYYHEMFKALADCCIDHRYSAIHIYEHTTASVKLHKETNLFKIEQDVC